MKLNPKLELLYVIIDFIEEKEYGPILREMIDGMAKKGLSTSTSVVHGYLDELEEEGLIERPVNETDKRRIPGRILYTKKGWNTFYDYQSKQNRHDIEAKSN